AFAFGSSLHPLRLQPQLVVARRRRDRPAARRRDRQPDRRRDRDLDPALRPYGRRDAARRPAHVIGLGKFRYRFERFGGVLMFEKPALLVTATRAFLRRCGLDGGTAWAAPEDERAVPRLSAPVEAHLALTNAC